MTRLTHSLRRRLDVLDDRVMPSGTTAVGAGVGVGEGVGDGTGVGVGVAVGLGDVVGVGVGDGVGVGGGDGIGGDTGVGVGVGVACRRWLLASEWPSMWVRYWLIRSHPHSHILSHSMPRRQLRS